MWDASWARGCAARAISRDRDEWSYDGATAMSVRFAVVLVAVFDLTTASMSLLAQQGAPKDPAATRKADLVELVRLDPTVKLDIRYAGSDNFLGKPVYPEARAFLQRPAAEGLVAAHRELAAHGYGLLIHDGYRPWAITKLFWDMTPPALREFVADPATGSKHNRGCAVDLTMYDRGLGTAVEIRLSRRSSRRARTPRPATRRHGAPRLHRRAERVVALQLQGLARIPDPGYRVSRHQVEVHDATEARRHGETRLSRVAQFSRLNIGIGPETAAILVRLSPGERLEEDSQPLQPFEIPVAVADEDAVPAHAAGLLSRRVLLGPRTLHQLAHGADDVRVAQDRHVIGSGNLEQPRA
jgi:D-alanyl-D-alanine dipeptidase